MTDNDLTKILWHVQKTGNASMVTIPNVFTEQMRGGVFYKNGEQWLCCGTFVRTGSFLTFAAWISENLGGFMAGVPAHGFYKILVFDNNQWLEVQVKKATNVMRNVVEYSGDLKAISWEFLRVVSSNDMVVSPIDIVPSMHEAILQTPTINMPETYEFSSVHQHPNCPRTFSFQPTYTVCKFKSVTAINQPAYIKKVAMGMSETIVIDNDLLKIKAKEGEPDFFDIVVTAIPENPDFPEFSKTVTIKISHDEPAVNGNVTYFVSNGILNIVSDTMFTKNILVRSCFDRTIRKYKYENFFNLYDRNPVAIQISLNSLPDELKSGVGSISVYFQEFAKYVNIPASALKA